jgi:hypothetical protein
MSKLLQCRLRSRGLRDREVLAPTTVEKEDRRIVAAHVRQRVSEHSQFPVVLC